MAMPSTYLILMFAPTVTDSSIDAPTAAALIVGRSQTVPEIYNDVAIPKKIAAQRRTVLAAGTNSMSGQLVVRVYPANTTNTPTATTRYTLVSVELVMKNLSKFQFFMSTYLKFGMKDESTQYTEADLTTAEPIELDMSIPLTLNRANTVVSLGRL